MYKNIRWFDEPTDFSLVPGGPLYRIFLRCHLVREPVGLIARRTIVLTLFTWVPLLAFSATAGEAVGTGVQVPFLLDLEAQARFLVALPLLMAAEVLVHRRLKPEVCQFLERGIIRPEDRPRFEDMILRAMRFRNSLVPEIVLFIFVMTGGHVVWREISLDGEFWYARTQEQTTVYTPAGNWYAWISIPIFRFILFRWYLRLFIWFLFLWRTSRLGLDLNGLHPDRAGGLGFLARTVPAFSLVFMAHSALAAGFIGNRIRHGGEKLPDFKFEIGGLIIFLMILALTPLLFFMKPLAEARRVTRRRFGMLASRYVGDFRAKWMAADGAGGEPILGNADIQSLADLSNSHAVVREMSTLPFGRETVIQIAVAAALPLLPLVFTMVPVDQLIGMIVGAIL